MIGFIGTGNMANAMIRGLIKSGINPQSIYASNRDTRKARKLGDELKINVCDNNSEVVNKSKYIYIAVKPNIYDAVLNEIRDLLTNEHVIITMAPGYEIDRTKHIIGGNIKVTRIMPNTPALVGEGYTAVCFEKGLPEDEKDYVLFMINSFGKAQAIDEHYVNAYSAVTGSGPAFAFVIIEAMADAAVMLGIPRQEAYNAVEQTLLGSSKLALETGKHPGELKDMVCSPGGTSIEGVRTLEEQGVRGALIECIINTYKKNLDITNIR